MPLKQIIEIPDDRWVKFKVPKEMPTGKANIVIFPVQEKTDAITSSQTITQETKEPLKGREFGCHKGKVWMADDFNEPLEDFKDYM